MSRPQRTVGTGGTGGGFAVLLASLWLCVTTVLTTVLCCFPTSTHSMARTRSHHPHLCVEPDGSASSSLSPPLPWLFA